MTHKTLPYSTPAPLLPEWLPKRHVKRKMRELSQGGAIVTLFKPNLFIELGDAVH